MRMCVQLLHLRVQVFVTVPFFLFTFLLLFQISLKIKKYRIGKEKNTPTNKNQCDFLLHESV